MSSASLAMISPHPGLPPLDQGGRPLSFFEFWPQQIFYAPMVLYWLWLSFKYGGFTLPTIANPSFPFGGWIGESKDAVLNRAGPLAREHIAPWISFVPVRGAPPDATARAAIAQMSLLRLDFPMVAKPDKGCRGAGVRRVRNENELVHYIAAFPPGERIILQSLIDFDAEAGIFYVREPSAQRGRLVSLTLKYFP